MSAKQFVKEESLLQVALKNSAKGKVQDCMKAISEQRNIFKKKIHLLKAKNRQLEQTLRQKMALIEQLDEKLAEETNKYDMLVDLNLQKETLQKEIKALEDEYNKMRRVIRVRE